MKSNLHFAFAASMIAVVLAAGSTGCVDSGDDSVTCGHYEDFLLTCTDNCSPQWDCEHNYNLMSGYNQARLDACSDCLAANLSVGICADCSSPELGVGSCHDYMEFMLGVVCW